MLKFSEIKEKVQNLGEFKTLAKIKSAGLRVVQNKKTGDYWLIEGEFLKPIVKGPKDCKSIQVKPGTLRYKVFMCHNSREDLKNTKATAYIAWGEKQKLDKRRSFGSSANWYDAGKREEPSLFIIKGTWQRHFTPIPQGGTLCDQQMYEISFKKLNKSKWELISFLSNATTSMLFLEVLGRSNFGEGILWLATYEAAELLVLEPEILKELDVRTAFKDISNRKIKSVWEEIGINPSKPIRRQEPKPLPDRKLLDDIVFDAIGLTEQERKEVYWAVCGLVKNRLDKAKSV